MGLRTQVPNTDFIDAARQQKLILIGAGENVARLLPPLIVTEAEIGEAVRRLDAACVALEAALKGLAEKGVAE
jgi:acetylornithine/N-succinyldiaminopimelate aminotransferase